VARVPFVKMHGCGNDFIVFDDSAALFSWAMLADLARRHCPRRTGIGADGLIAVGHPPAEPDTSITTPREGWDCEMRYVNADGSSAEMCGNGIRCLGKYVADELGDSRGSIRVLTGHGVLEVLLHRNEAGLVHSATVSMGVPRLDAAQVPTMLGAPGKPVIAAPLEAGGERLAVTAVNMGNPHAVCFVDPITDHHVLTLGPLVETHGAFPLGVNAEFVQVLAPDRLRMRVWERGCGETWACGTGACASVVAAVLNGHAAHGHNVTVVLNGGELIVNWPAPDAEVLMTGPAVSVFGGEMET
jgi:diaminopimelate epimerase